MVVEQVSFNLLKFGVWDGFGLTYWLLSLSLPTSI